MQTNQDPGTLPELGVLVMYDRLVIGHLPDTSADHFLCLVLDLAFAGLLDEGTFLDQTLQDISNTYGYPSTRVFLSTFAPMWRATLPPARQLMYHCAFQTHAEHQLPAVIHALDRELRNVA